MVRDALRAVGVRAISCDLRPSRRGWPHIQADVRKVLSMRHWRGLVAHPPCQYLANSGARWLYGGKGTVRDEARWRAMEEGAAFFNLFRDADHIPLRAIENSTMHGHAMKLVGRGPDHITQPWMFGDPFTKASCWWLYGLPGLVPLYSRYHFEFIGPKCHFEAPSPERDRIRSETEPGIASAIAAQWGPLF